MKRAALTLLATLASTSVSLAGSVCMDAAEMEAGLIDWYGETPVTGAMADDQQLWASDATGTWTLMRLNNDGTACVLGQGNNWKAADDPLITLRDSLDGIDGDVSTEVATFLAALSAERL